MEDLIGAVVEVYRQKQEIKATAVELDLEPQKVKKLLVTARELCYPETETILSYKKRGKTLTEIQEIMQLGRSSVNAYLPYSKAVYKSEEISRNAEKVKCYRKRKEAMEKLQENMMEERLWDCIVAFHHYPFYTASGLPFTYTLKTGRTENIRRSCLLIGGKAVRVWPGVLCGLHSRKQSSGRELFSTVQRR